MTATSILYSCMWYDEVELYVDPIGFEYLSELPCKITLVDFENDQHLWMKSKLYAIQQQEVPFVHLDTDVFIKQRINFDFDTVLVERKDLNYYNYKDLINFFDPYCKGMPFWNPTLRYAWSCGVVGFKDLKLRDEFVKSFNTLEKVFNDNSSAYDIFSNDQRRNGWYIEPSLLLEQYNLASLLVSKYIYPSVLIPKDDLQEQSSYANNIGYVHLLGASKYHPKNTSKIKEMLFQKFPESYHMIKNRIESDIVV